MKFFILERVLPLVVWFSLFESLIVPIKKLFLDIIKTMDLKRRKISEE
jgi:hypothetical protein